MGNFRKIIRKIIIESENKRLVRAVGFINGVEPIQANGYTFISNKKPIEPNSIVPGMSLFCIYGGGFNEGDMIVTVSYIKGMYNESFATVDELLNHYQIKNLKEIDNLWQPIKLDKFIYGALHYVQYTTLLIELVLVRVQSSQILSYKKGL
jgi:hypothetical protein